MKGTLGKKLSEKPDRTPQEDEMIRLLMEGGNVVDADSLKEIIQWYRGE